MRVMYECMYVCMCVCMNVLNTGTMCGCCSWAVSSISCLKRSKFTPAAEWGESTFTTTPTTERVLLRQKHATHSTAAEFAFYAIGAGQRGLQPIAEIGLQVLNLCFEQSRGIKKKKKKKITGSALPRRAHPLIPTRVH